MVTALSVETPLQFYTVAIAGLFGVLLFVLLSGFGITVFQLQRARQFRQTDEELQRRMAELANVVRGPRPRQGPPGFPNSQERLPEPSPRDENFPGRPRPERPYPDMQRGEGDFPGRPNLGPQEFHLPPRLANLFEDTEKGEFYFRI